MDKTRYLIQELTERRIMGLRPDMAIWLVLTTKKKKVSRRERTFSASMHCIVSKSGLRTGLENHAEGMYQEEVMIQSCT